MNTATVSKPTIMFRMFPSLHRPFVKLCIVYLLYMIAHFISPYVYIQFCTPQTFIGFLTSPFMIPTPHCKAIRWIMTYSASNIETMWALLGVWGISLVISVEPETNKEPRSNIIEE